MNAKVLEEARCSVTAVEVELANLDEDEEEKNSVSTTNEKLNNDFDGTDRCCCQMVHIKRGAYTVLLISAFCIVTNLLMKIAGYSETAWDWELLFLVVDSIAIASMFYGVYSERAAFIQPFVVLSIITTSLLVLLAAQMACAAYDPNSAAGQDLEHELNKRLSDTAHQLSVQLKSMISIVATVFLIFILLFLSAHCWFIWLAVRCAKYLRKLDEKTAHSIGETN